MRERKFVCGWLERQKGGWVKKGVKDLQFAVLRGLILTFHFH